MMFHKAYLLGRQVKSVKTSIFVFITGTIFFAIVVATTATATATAAAAATTTASATATARTEYVLTLISSILFPFHRA